MNIFWTDEFKCHGRIWSEKHNHAPVLFASMVWRPNNKVCKSTSWLSSPAHIKHNSQFHAALLHNFLLQFLLWKSWSYFHWFDYCPIQVTQLLAKFTVMIFVFNYTDVMIISLICTFAMTGWVSVCITDRHSLLANDSRSEWWCQYTW